MADRPIIARKFESACPKCHKHLTIELDFEPTSERGVAVTCDHCGVTKRLSAFQRELARQVREEEKKQRRATRDRERLNLRLRRERDAKIASAAKELRAAESAANKTPTPQSVAIEPVPTNARRSTLTSESGADLAFKRRHWPLGFETGQRSDRISTLEAANGKCRLMAKDGRNDTIDVFLSYARSDDEWRLRVRDHLRTQEREGIKIWDDQCIDPGVRWQPAVKQALGVCRVAVLIVSARFLASEFVARVELPALRARVSKGEVIVLALVVSASRVTRTWLGQHQFVNDPARPLDRMDSGRQEEILKKLADDVERSLSCPRARVEEPSTETVPTERVAAEPDGNAAVDLLGSLVAGDTSDSVVRLLKLLGSSTGNDAVSPFLIGYWYRLRGKQRCLDYLAEVSKTKGLWSAAAAYELALFHYGSKQYSTAIDLLLQLIGQNLDPRIDISSSCLLGMCWLARRELERVKPVLERIRRHTNPPATASAHSAIQEAVLCLAVGDNKRAERAIDHLLSFRLGRKGLRYPFLPLQGRFDLVMASLIKKPRFRFRSSIFEVLGPDRWRGISLVAGRNAAILRGYDPALRGIERVSETWPARIRRRTLTARLRKYEGELFQ